MKKKIGLALFVATLCMGLVFAGGQKQEQSKKPMKIASIIMYDAEFMKLLQKGMVDAGKEAGVEVLTANADSKLEKEFELVNTYVSSGVAGICIHPQNADGSVPVLKSANDAGVKIFCAGMNIKADFHVGYAENDQKELGRLTGIAARNFIEKNLGGKAKIALLQFKIQLPELSTARSSGFIEEVTKLPGVKIVSDQDAWTPEMSVAKASEIMNANPDLNIIWSANEGGTVGSTMAVKNQGMQGKVFVFGTDCTEQFANMILSPDNILQHVTGQQPYVIGRTSMQNLLKAINGEKVQKATIIPGFEISRLNPDSAKKFIEDNKKLTGK